MITPPPSSGAAKESSGKTSDANFRPYPLERIFLILHAIAAVVLAAFLILVVAWPAIKPSAIGPTLDRCLDWYCHRLPRRSLSWDGEPLAVCARCTGVIAGYLLAAVLALFGAERLWLWRIPWAILMILLMGLSWLSGRLGWLQESWHWERVLAGGLGGAGGYILIGCCVVMILRWWQRRQYAE